MPSRTYDGQLRLHRGVVPLFVIRNQPSGGARAASGDPPGCSRHACAPAAISAVETAMRGKPGTCAASAHVKPPRAVSFSRMTTTGGVLGARKTKSARPSRPADPRPPWTRSHAEQCATARTRTRTMWLAALGTCRSIVSIGETIPEGSSGRRSANRVPLVRQERDRCVRPARDRPDHCLVLGLNGDDHPRDGSVQSSLSAATATFRGGGHHRSRGWKHHLPLVSGAGEQALLAALAASAAVPAAGFGAASGAGVEACRRTRTATIATAGSADNEGHWFSPFDFLHGSDSYKSAVIRLNCGPQDRSYLSHSSAFSGWSSTIDPYNARSASSSLRTSSQAARFRARLNRPPS